LTTYPDSKMKPRNLCFVDFCRILHVDLQLLEYVTCVIPVTEQSNPKTCSR
jgi:hypothetical protein